MASPSLPSPNGVHGGNGFTATTVAALGSPSLPSPKGGHGVWVRGAGTWVRGAGAAAGCRAAVGTAARGGASEGQGPFSTGVGRPGAEGAAESRVDDSGYRGEGLHASGDTVGGSESESISEGSGSGSGYRGEGVSWAPGGSGSRTVRPAAATKTTAGPGPARAASSETIPRGAAAAEVRRGPEARSPSGTQPRPAELPPVAGRHAVQESVRVGGSNRASHGAAVLLAPGSDSSGATRRAVAESRSFAEAEQSIAAKWNLD